MTVASDTRVAETNGPGVPQSVTLRRLLWLAFGVQAALGPALSVGFGLPAALKWLDELALAGLVVLIIARALRTRALVPGTLGASWPLVAYTAAVCASAAVNRTAVVEAVLGWRSLAQFLLFYVALVSIRFDFSDLKAFFTGFLATSLIHVPFAIDQVIKKNTAGVPLGPDDVTGAFGAGTANLFGYFCALILLVSFCQILISDRRRYWFVAFPIGLAWPLTSANGSYLVFTLLCLAAFVVSPQLRRLKNVIQMGVFVVAELSCLGYIANTQYHLTLTEQLISPVKGVARYKIDHLGNPGRLVLTRDTVLLLAEDARTLVFGLGPGSVGAVPGMGRQPSNFDRFSKRTQANFVSASLIGYLAELGIAGVLCVLLAWAHMLLMAWLARWRTTDMEERTWLLVAVLVVPFMALAGAGDVSWTFQPLMYPFGALTAFATVRFHEQRAARGGRGA